MSLPILLLAGCGLWVVNETLEIFTAGLANIVGTSGGLATALLCIGIWIFWTDPAADRLSRAGTLLASGGLALTTYRTVSLALQGERSDAQIVASPLFLVAAACIAVGVLLLGARILRRGAFPRWIGAVLTGVTCLTLVLALQGAGPLVQSGANIVLAITLAETAVLAMGRRR
jgi:hypothetical protein